MSLVVTSALTPTESRAQEAEFRPGRIVTLETDEIPGEDARAVSGLREGQELTRPLARQAIRALWSTGRVTDVRILSRPVQGGVAVRIQLGLNQVIRGLEMSYPQAEDPVLDQQEVARSIGYFAGMEFHPDLLEQMSVALRETYGRRGYPDATVDLAIEPSQDDPEVVSLRVSVRQGAPLRLAEVSFSGQLGLPERQVRRIFGVEPGEVYDRVAVDEGISRLIDLYRSEGYFQVRIDSERASASISGEGAGRRAHLVIPVDAGNHYAVDFVGNRRISDEDLREIVALEEELELSRAILDTLAQRIEDHYRARGYYYARVDWRAWQLEEWRRRLAFRIRAGPQVRVVRIEFEGNEHFDDRYLRRQLESLLQERLSEEGLLRTVSDEVTNAVGVAGEGHERWRPRPRPHLTLQYNPTEVYQEEVYLEALGHIKDLYATDGFLSAQLAQPTLEFSGRGRRLAVTIGVDEGPRTHINSITFANNSALTNEQILAAIGFEVGSPLNRYDVEQARRAIIRRYHERGYIFAGVSVEEYLSEDHLTADLRFDVVEGPQVRVRTVTVRGNELTRTSLIRDRITLGPGDIFSPQAASRSERALIDLGIFSSVSVTLAEPEVEEASKDLVVEVVERRPQYLELRGGFSTADGPRAEVRYGYNNLVGYSLGFEMRLRGSFQVFFFNTPEFEDYFRDLDLVDQLERLVVVSMRLPHIPRIGRALNMRLDATHERDNDPAYAVTRSGVSLSLNSGYRPFFSAQLQTGFDYADVAQVLQLADCSEVDNPRPNVNCFYENLTLTRLRRRPEGQSWFWVTRLLLSLDFRDNPFNPTRGFFGSLSAEHVYSLQPVRQLIDQGNPEDPSDNVYGDFTSNLIKLTTTLNGYIPLVLLDMVLALSVRFGWIFELIPENLTFADRFFYLGGFDSMRGFPEESMYAQDIQEYGGRSMINMRAELRIPIRNAFALGVFLDTGNIWREQINMWHQFALRYNLGAGLRINTPVGPLAFDGAFVLDRRTNERLAFFHFAIGLF